MNDFGRLFAAGVASQFATRIGQHAIALLAVSTLGALPWQIGILGAAHTVGLLITGLPAGAWVDRVRRRELMVTMDIVRAGLAATIVLAGWFGSLDIWHLVLVSLSLGAASVLFDVAQLSYLPTLVGRADLLASNAKLQASHAVAAIAGPAIAGGLLVVTGGPLTLLAMTAGYVLSVVQLRRIRAAEPMVPHQRRTSLRAEMVAGLRLVFGHPLLRAVALGTATANLFMAVAVTINTLFLVRDLGLSPGVAGALLASGGAGGILGAMTATKVAAVTGPVRAIWLSLICTQPFGGLLPLTAPDWRLGLFALGWMAVGYGSTVYNVTQVSLRQSVCPQDMLGRMNASNRVVVWSTLPAGSLLGGLLAEWLGARAGLWFATAGLTLSAMWLICSPLRHLRTVPTA